VEVLVFDCVLNDASGSGQSSWDFGRLHADKVFGSDDDRTESLLTFSKFVADPRTSNLSVSLRTHLTQPFVLRSP